VRGLVGPTTDRGPGKLLRHRAEDRFGRHRRSLEWVARRHSSLRRSVRRFSDEPVPAQLVEAAQ